MEPKGILRNKDETEPYHSNSDELDRKEVIRNTQLNSHMNNESSRGDKIRAQINQAKKDQGLPVDDKHAKWDEISLYKNEQERSATMKIDEPKTPYEGGFDPNGEYYQEDEEIPDFELGQGAQVNYENTQSLGGGEVLKNEDEDEDEEDDEPKEKPLTAEERHKLFEQKRKEHYHMKADALHHKIQIDDEDDE